MKEDEQAKQFVVNAKQLRRSTDSIIRDTVYINRNLTCAEAAAAYHVSSFKVLSFAASQQTHPRRERWLRRRWSP